MQFHDHQGNRLDLSTEERRIFIAAATRAEEPVRTFCTVLHDTGCRISEALSLTPTCIDLTGQAIVFKSAKKHNQGITRMVPVPPALLEALDRVHAIKVAQQGASGQAGNRLWLWSRTTAWRRVGEVMEMAGIPRGPHRSPKGIRCGFAAHAIRSGVPVQVLSRWMGNADPGMAALHTHAFGKEEKIIATRMWENIE
jgi:integrase